MNAPPDPTPGNGKKEKDQSVEGRRYDFRYDLPGNGTNPGATTVVGDTSGFGTRVQLSF